MEINNRISGLGQPSPDPPIGHLLSSAGAKIPIRRLSIDKEGDWWGGRISIRGGTIETGIFRLLMNDGGRAELSIDEIRKGHFGLVSAAFHGIGPPPESTA